MILCHVVYIHVAGHHNTKGLKTHNISIYLANYLNTYCDTVVSKSSLVFMDVWIVSMLYKSRTCTCTLFDVDEIYRITQYFYCSMAEKY